MKIIKKLEEWENGGGNRSSFVREYNKTAYLPINYAALTSAMFRYSNGVGPIRDEAPKAEVFSWPGGHAVIPHAAFPVIYEKIGEILKAEEARRAKNVETFEKAKAEYPEIADDQ